MKMSCILSIMVIVIFCSTSVVFSADWKKEAGKEGPGKSQYSQRHGDEKAHSEQRSHQKDKAGHDTVRRGDHDKGPDYRHHTGYSAAPFEKNRHYDHQDYKGHRYAYQGHWKSWKQWNSYAKEHPDIRKTGGYYREDAHLMFRFRDPVTGSYLFFSIGR